MCILLNNKIMLKIMEFMKIALKEGMLAMNAGNIPIGCVIVQDNEIISQAHNAEFWHAEILCIQAAQIKMQEKFLLNAVLFSTIKPCPMCTHAIKLARIPVVYFGADNQKDCLTEPAMIGCIYEQEAISMMQNFFKIKR